MAEPTRPVPAFRYPWEVPPEEQTLLELVDTIEVALCAHGEPSVPTKDIQGWMDLLKQHIRKGTG